MDFSRKLLLVLLCHHGLIRCHARGSGDKTLLFFYHSEDIVIVISGVSLTVSSQIFS